MSDKKLIIFSKAPDPGLVKTRLIPALGQHKATQLYRYMLEQTVLMAHSLEGIDCELHCSPDTQHPFFTQLAEKYPFKRVSQQGANLGDKMAFALQQTLKNSQQCVIIGCDCPAIDSAYIKLAFERLSSTDVVIGPASDGGYVLIGSNISHSKIFNNINWSTAQVLHQTIKNLDLLRLNYHKLGTLSDIDTMDDLAHLPTHYLNHAFTRPLK